MNAQPKPNHVILLFVTLGFLQACAPHIQHSVHVHQRFALCSILTRLCYTSVLHGAPG